MSLKQFGKDTFIYSAGNLLIRFVSFLLVPIYTNVFTQEEFGTFSLVFTFIGFIQIFYNYGMASSLMKFYRDDPAEKKQVITTIFLTLAITSVLFSVLLLLFSGSLASILFSVDRPEWFAYIAGILVLDTLSVRAMILIRFENRPTFFTLAALANVVVSLAANILFVYVEKMGITGAIISTLISSIVSFLLVLPTIIRNLDFSTYSSKLLKKMLSFGLPFLPAAIFQIVMDLADRYLIDWIIGRDAVGVYNAGYKIGSLMLIMTTGFNLGWQPYFLSKEKDKDAPRLFSRIALLVVTVFAVIWVLFILFSEELIRIQVGSISLIGPAFWSSSSVIPIVMAGYVFLLFYDLFMPGIFYSNRSGLLPVYRAIGAGSNILLNLIFIPLWGIHGAAWATCISFALMSVPLYFKTQKLFYIPFQWGKTGTLLILGAGIFIAQYLVPFSFWTKGGIFLVFIGISGWILRGEIRSWLSARK